MSPRSPAGGIRRCRRGRALLPIAVLVIAWALAPATAASAHDRIVSTAPSDGGHLDAAPTEVSMVYSDSIVGLGAAVVVADEDDADWSDGPVTIDGPQVVQPLRAGMPDGVYEVRWRVVSRDGHPIAGTYRFAVGDADASAATAAAAEDGTGTGTGATATPGSAQTATSAPPSPADVTAAGPMGAGSSIMRTAGIAAIGAVIGIGVFTAVTWFRGRRRTS